MGDQMAPADQIGDQIFIVTKMWKLGYQLGRPVAFLGRLL